MQLTVTEARKRWSEILDRVETVAVTRRGEVVASFVRDNSISGLAAGWTAKSE